MGPRFFFDESYDLGGGLPMRSAHGFVLNRPSRMRRALIEGHGVPASIFERAPVVPRGELGEVHTAGHRRQIGSAKGIAAAVELPMLARLPSFLVRRAVLRPQLAASGGTIAAVAHAAGGGWAFNLSGGFHHARPDRAHGFCLVNDVALAVAALRRTGASPKIAIIDLDAHQGDGNAAAFEDDADVFTLSLHEAEIFPHPKLQSTCDIGLAGGLDDTQYLAYLEDALLHVGNNMRPDIVIYVAGVDAHADDPLSTLALSADGLIRRDERVARFAREQGAGLVMLPAGGYTTDSPLWSAAGMVAVAALAP